MKLQLAIDDLTLKGALELGHIVEPYIDIIEMGSPFIMAEGMHVVREFCRQFPRKEILADLKIMDAGFHEAELAFKAGADYATVLGVTDMLTIKGCQEAAQKYGKKVYVDMICVDNLPQRICEVEQMGVHGISVHTGVDQQAGGRTAMDDLKEIIKYRMYAEISVAGGINSKTARFYMDEKADVLIVGGGICHAENPFEEAKAIAEIIRET